MLCTYLVCLCTGQAHSALCNNIINDCQDHLQEVLDKWDSIDDEIWAKIVVLERNRRVAKAYARAPVLTVNGTDQGFDGFRIGLSGFENPMRDIGTEESIKQINQVSWDFWIESFMGNVTFSVA